MPSRLTIPAPADFDLAAAVCSYGFYALAPHQWDPHRRTLTRPLRDTNGDVITAHINAGPEPARAKGRTSPVLHITIHPALGRAHHAHIKRQVARMLRLDEDLAAFHRLHRAARRRGFGRIFRSPTVFEDLVRTMTCCNTAWSNTTTMNRLLCEKVGAGGDFPTPAELARWSPARLKRATKVGYRAERMIRLARDVEADRLDLAALEDPGRDADELDQALRRIHGVGQYSANNMLQLLGRYDRIPVDSEVVAMFRKRDNDPAMTESQAAARAAEYYAPYHPYQFLAYWHDLWPSV